MMKRRLSEDWEDNLHKNPKRASIRYGEPGRGSSLIDEDTFGQEGLHAFRVERV